MTARFASLEVSEAELSPEGLRFVTAKSANLRRRGDVTFWAMPGAERYAALVVLLHGVYGSHWAWAFKGAAHRIAREACERGDIGPVVLAMPSDGLWGDGSGYLRHEHADYEAWIMEDVPALAAEVYGPAAVDAPLCLSGLSMGGFGALRLGLKYRDRVAAVSAHSSATNRQELQGYIREPLDEAFQDLDVATLWSDAKAEGGRLPPLRFDCGDRDPVAVGNRELHARLTAASVNHVYEELPGAHDWPYWRENLPRSLRFFGSVLKG